MSNQNGSTVKRNIFASANWSNWVIRTLSKLSITNIPQGIMRKTLTICAVISLILITSLIPLRIAHASTLEISEISRDLKIADSEYSKYYYGSAKVKSGFTGNVSKCQPGQTSTAFQNAYTRAVNYVRSIVGVNSITYNPNFNSEAQQAALIMSANRDLTHEPPSDWRCWTQQGYDGANQSNLHMAYANYAKREETVSDSLESYLSDRGDNNKPVGHRTSILRPNQTSISVGEAVDTTINSNALHNEVDWYAPVLESANAWPSAGYFPSVFVPNSNRWSFTYYDESLNFSKAQVKIWKNGQLVSGAQIKIIYYPSENRYSKTLVWEFSGYQTPKNGAVDKYTVEISNAFESNGLSAISYVYDVLVFQPTLKQPLSVGLKIDRPVLQNIYQVDQFVDLKKDSTMSRDVSWAVGAGVAIDCKMLDGQYYYCPEDLVSRADMAQFLYRMAGSPDLAKVPTSYFQDLDKVSSEQKRAIDWLYATKIAGACNAKLEFCPKRIVNRGELAELFFRYSGSRASTKLIPKATDIDELSSVRKKAIDWITAENILGVKNHKFSPDLPIKRGDLAQYLHRLASRTKQV